MMQPPHHRDQEEEVAPSSSSPIGVIRKEYLELTHHPLMATLLNQLVYWSQRVADFEKYVEEERKGSESNSSPDSNHGWFYKTASALIDEAMLGVTKKTFRTYRSFLIDRGWIQIRQNPENRWDRTVQYRVNLRNLHRDLQKKGYSLPAFSLGEGFGIAQCAQIQKVPLEREEDGSSIATECSPRESKAETFEEEEGSPSKGTKCSILPEPFLHQPLQNPSVSREGKCGTLEREEKGDSKETNLPSRRGKTDLLERVKSTCSKGKKGSARKGKMTSCNTETTTEITNREKEASAREEKSKKDVLEDAVSTWKRHLHQDLTLTSDRRQKLRILLKTHFQNDPIRWEQFCERISGSTFLRGEGKQGWRVNFDWILDPRNTRKVLEGNYDDTETVDQRRNLSLKKARAKQMLNLLETIQDSLWKGWCTKLAQGTAYDSRTLLLSELKTLQKVQGIEFDGRLVWIACPDVTTQSCVESLRLKLLTIAQSTYPKARNIRTQLSSSPNKKEKKNA